MAYLAYRARDERGRLHRGEAEARDEIDLADRLDRQGLLLVEARAHTPRARVARVRMSRQELILFTFQIQTIISGGIPLLTGLDDLREQSRSGAVRQMVADLQSAIQSGATLSQALSRYPSVFPAAYVRMVEGGEAGGRLDQTLGRLVHLLEWREDLRGQMKQLVTYPAIVVTAMVGLMGLLLGFVLPRFQPVLESFEVQLPASTRFLLGASAFVRAQWPWILACFAMLATAAWILKRVPRSAEALDAMLLRIPVVGALHHSLVASQIAHFLGAFIETGVPIGIALDLVAGIVENRRIGRRIRAVRDRVLEGDTLTGAFKASGVLPSLVLRMVSIGEESGTMPDSLAKASQYYDREIPRQVKALFDLAGPVLTVILGIGLLFTILSVLLPVYKMYSAISGGVH